MIGKLLTTTALIAVLTGGAFAASSAATQPSSAISDSKLLTGYTMASTDVLTSKLIGTKIYDGSAQNAQEIGTIKDLVLNKQGTIAAAVVAVGGILGVGEKDVAVDYPAFSWAMNTDGSDRAVLPTTQDALNSAPAFAWPTEKSAALTNNTAGSNGRPTSALTVGTRGTGTDNSSLTSNSGSTTASDNALVRPSQLSPVQTGSMKSDDLKGIDVISPAGVKLGSIGDFVLTKDGQVDAVIVDFGGFLGIGTKQVAVQYKGLTFLSDKNNKRYLEVNVTKDQLNAQQAYNKSTYPTDRNRQLLTVGS